MERIRAFGSACALAIAVVLAGAPTLVYAQDATPAAALPEGVEVVAAGLTNPRGFAWDEASALYLALAGTGGETEGNIDGVPSGLMGGKTASVARIEDGCTVPVAEGLPSSLWPDPGWIWGVHDVDFFEGQLYLLSAGGGSDYGNPDVANGLYRVEDDGSVSLIADLSAFFRANPTVFIPPDYGPDGSLFDLEVAEDRFWISEAVGGRVLTATPDGQITLVADLSELKLTPTGIALAPQGGVYLGFETTVPFVDGTSNVIHLAEDGTETDVWTGLTAVTDVVLGPDGALYAAEMATGNVDAPPYLTPGSGRVVRQAGPDQLEEVVTGAQYPVNLGFDEAGMLYLTTPAFGPDAGVGQGALIKVDISGGSPVSLAGMGELPATCADGTPESTPA